MTGALGGQGGLINVVAQGLQHLAGTLCRERGGGQQGLGQVAGALRLGGQTGALPHRMGQQDRQTGRGQGDHGEEGQPQRLQIKAPGAVFKRAPGHDAGDPQGGGQPGDQIGVAAGRDRLGRGAGHRRGRRRRIIGGGRRGGGFKRIDDVSQWRRHLSLYLGLHLSPGGQTRLFLGQLALAAFGHWALGRCLGRGRLGRSLKHHV